MPDAPAAATVHLDRLTKRFGRLRPSRRGDAAGGSGVLAVDDVTMTIPQGSFFALLGPSGCGKTTTLRMIGGLEEPTAGRILLDGDDVTYRKPYRRPVNTVFQNYALFPHLDIAENVAFGLRRKGVRDVAPQVEAMLDLVELAGYGPRRPAQLSGGQQQRVALARALINHPRVLLLDEPLGALDLKLRRQMQLELKRIQTEVGVTFVHVTHDQEEAMTMADQIAVMHAGKVEQLGTPVELYERPATAFVAEFLGQSNLLAGRVADLGGDGALVEVHGRRLAVGPLPGHAHGDRVRVGVRPEKIQLVAADADPRPGANELDGTLAESSFTGVSIQYLVRTSWDQELTVFAQNLARDERLVPGARVRLRWAREHTFVVPAGGPDTGAGAGEAAGGGPDAVEPEPETPGSVAQGVAGPGPRGAGLVP